MSRLTKVKCQIWGFQDISKIIGLECILMASIQSKLHTGAEEAI